MFFSTPGWEFGQPVGSGGQSTSDRLTAIYAQLGKQMGLTLFLPLVSSVLNGFFGAYR
jgi:hypothetical protein